MLFDRRQYVENFFDIIFEIGLEAQEILCKSFLS